MIAINVTRDENDKLDMTVSLLGSYAEIIDETIAGAAAILREAYGGMISYDCALELLHTIIGAILDNRDLEEGLTNV